MSVAAQAPEVPLQGTPLTRPAERRSARDRLGFLQEVPGGGRGIGRIFLTYDRGDLEIMAPLWNHEWWKRRVGYLLPVLGHELKIKVQGGGSTTFRRRDLERGLEPDECFYIQHAVQMAGQREI